MKTERFEDIEAWQLAPVCRRTGRRELTRKVYRLTKKPGFVMKSAKRSTLNLEPLTLGENVFAMKGDREIVFEILERWVLNKET